MEVSNAGRATWVSKLVDDGMHMCSFVAKSSLPTSSSKTSSSVTTTSASDRKSEGAF